MEHICNNSHDLCIKYIYIKSKIMKSENKSETKQKKSYRMLQFQGYMSLNVCLYLVIFLKRVWGEGISSSD